jgi:flagellar hook assembly protein FlgD
MLGQRIRIVYSGNTSAGTKTYRWDGRNESGGRCASGVYIYSVEIDGKAEFRKMVLVK